MLVERRFMNMNEPVFPFVRLTEYEHLQKIFCISFLRWMFTKVPNRFKEVIFVKEGERKCSHNIVLVNEFNRYGLDPTLRTLYINLDTLMYMKVPDNSKDIPKYTGEYKEKVEIDLSNYSSMFGKDEREKVNVCITVLMATLVHEVMHSFVVTDFHQSDNNAYMWQIEYLVDARTRDFLYHYESEIKTVFNIDICHAYIDMYLEFARRKYFPGEFVGDKYGHTRKI